MGIDYVREQAWIFEKGQVVSKKLGTGFPSVAAAIIAPILVTGGLQIYAEPYLWPLDFQSPVVTGELVGASLPAIVLGFLLARLLGGWPWQRGVLNSTVICLIPAFLISSFAVQGTGTMHRLERVIISCGDVEVLFPLGAKKLESSESNPFLTDALRGRQFFRMECAEFPRVLSHEELTQIAQNWDSSGVNRSISGIVEEAFFDNPSLEVTGTMTIPHPKLTGLLDVFTIYAQPQGNLLNLTSASPIGVLDDAFEFRTEN